MSKDIALLFLPWVLMLVPKKLFWFRGAFIAGIIATLISLVSIFLQYKNVTTNLGGGLIEAYGFIYAVSKEPSRLLFLTIVQISFLMSYALLLESSSNINLRARIMLAAQPLFSLLILSGNNFVTAASALMLTAVIFVGLLFSRKEMDSESIGIAYTFFAVYTAVGTLLMAWVLGVSGIMPNTAGGNMEQLKLLTFDQLNTGRGGVASLFLAISMLIAMPMAPWGKWFSRMFELLPESTVILVAIFVAVISFGFIQLAQNVVDEGMVRFRPIFMLLGVLTAFFSLGELFSKRTKRSMLSCMPRILFSIVLVGLGMSTKSSYRAAYLACLMLPLFSVMALYFTAIKLSHGFLRVLHFIFLFFMIGLPATPMFSAFGLLGGPTLMAGLNYALAFGLLWFLYFFANVYILRNLYLSDPISLEYGLIENKNASRLFALLIAVLIIAAMGVLPWLVRNYI